MSGWGTFQLLLSNQSSVDRSGVNAVVVVSVADRPTVEPSENGADSKEM